MTQAEFDESQRRTMERFARRLFLYEQECELYRQGKLDGTPAYEHPGWEIVTSSLPTVAP